MTYMEAGTDTPTFLVSLVAPLFVLVAPLFWILAPVALFFARHNAKGPAKNDIGRDDVPADDVLYLVERNAQVINRVVEYLRIRTREDLAQRGAERCKHCDALFVPVADKPWTLAGYCSRPCGLEQGEASIVFRSDEAPNARPTNIATRCSRGHVFEVLPSFAGCVRPCPTCGEKVRIGTS